MKYAFIALIIIFASCKKESNPAIKTTIIGSWTNNIATDKKLTITKDSLKWDNASFGSDSISVVANTIFIVYRNAPKEAAWLFNVSPNNDTLTLTSISNNNSFIYWRVK